VLQRVGKSVRQVTAIRQAAPLPFDNDVTTYSNIILSVPPLFFGLLKIPVDLFYSISMVVRLRLQRFGRTHRPFYRLVAANSEAPRDGKFLEIVGTYNPIANRAGMKEIRLKEDRLKYWLAVGAQPSTRASWILGKFGILPPLPHHYNPQKMQVRKEEKEK